MAELISKLTADRKKTILNGMLLAAAVVGAILIGKWIADWNRRRAGVPQASAVVVAESGLFNGGGLPGYDNYQSDRPVLPAASDAQAFPEAQGYTYESAIPPAPLCEVCNKKVCECWRAQVTADNCGRVTGCMDSQAANFQPEASIPCTNCCVPKIYGCLDPKATNYDPRANTPWQFCQYAQEFPGCTDPSALNFNKNATVDDGSCVAKVVGCRNPDAINYQADANISCDSCCNPKVMGCADPTAPNYNADVNVATDSCLKPTSVVLPAAMVPEMMCSNFATGGMCAPSGDTAFGGMLPTCDTWDTTSHDLGSNATGW